MRRPFTALAVSSLVLAAGCYTLYAPSRPHALEGRRVQITLTDSGSVVLAPRVGSSTETLAGMIVQDTAEAYVLSLSDTRTRAGVETDWKGERVAVPRALVARIEERRLSKTKTALFALAMATAAVAVRDAFLGGGGSTVPGQTPTTPGGPR